jgi:ABC-type maltose transport system permease subunit
VAEFSTSIDIDAPAEVVYEHLVTVEGLLAWMGQHAELHAVPGGEFAVGLQSYASEANVYWNQVMAASLVVSAPIVVTFLLLQRHITSGVTAGAVKCVAD